MRLHLALGLVVVVTLAGCGGGEKGRSEDAADASPSADVLKSLIGKHEKIAGMSPGRRGVEADDDGRCD